MVKDIGQKKFIYDIKHRRYRYRQFLGIALTILFSAAGQPKTSWFVFGFILVAFSTPLPDMSVALFSTVYGTLVLSVGDILGSNSTGITFVFGICAVLGGNPSWYLLCLFVVTKHRILVLEDCLR